MSFTALDSKHQTRKAAWHQCGSWFQIVPVHKHKPVVDAVLVVDMKQFVFDPWNLFGSFPPTFSLQSILFVDRCQTHHSLLSYAPLRVHGKIMRRSIPKTDRWLYKAEIAKIKKCHLLTLLSRVLSFTKLSNASLTRDRSFLAAVTMETMTSWRMASSGSCDLTLKNSKKSRRATRKQK